MVEKLWKKLPLRHFFLLCCHFYMFKSKYNIYEKHNLYKSFHILTEKATQTKLALYKTMNALMLKHNLTTINCIFLFYFHNCYPGEIPARPLKSRNYWNICLITWSRLKLIIPRSTDIQEQMRSKVNENYQSGNDYKDVSQQTTVSDINKWKKHSSWTNTIIPGAHEQIHPRDHKRTKHLLNTSDITCLS